MIFLIFMGIILYFCYVSWLADFMINTYGLRTKGTVLFILGTMTPLAILAQILYSLWGK
jgi:hypothetical protein